MSRKTIGRRRLLGPYHNDSARVFALFAIVLVCVASARAAEKANAALPPVQEVQIRSSKDGVEQPALFYVPPNAELEAGGKPAPLVVSLHSWSTGYSTYDSYAGVLRECRERGWVFISGHFRGPNNRPEACASDLAVADVLDAVAYAKRHARVDERRIYLLGGSGGGHMALVMAHRAPRLWAGVSAWVPISDLKAWHKFCKAAGYRYAKMLEQCCGGPPGTPATDREYRKRSPLFHLAAAKSVRIDIQAGIHDGHGGAAVPISHSLRAFNVLAEANGHGDKMLSEKEIAVMTDQARIPEHLAKERATEPGRQHKILFRRSAGPVRITIFDSGHRIDSSAAIRWLATTAKDATP